MANDRLVGEWPDGKPFRMTAPREVSQAVAKALVQTPLDTVTLELPEGGQIIYHRDGFCPVGVLGHEDRKDYGSEWTLAL